MSTIRFPKLAQGATSQDLARGLLAISDVACQLSLFTESLQRTKSDSILTGCVRRMSVSLRSILVDNKGRLFTRLFQDGCFPGWPTTLNGLLAKHVVDVSPAIEIESEDKQTGERRRICAPPYRHGFVVNALHGIQKSRAGSFAILGSTKVWTCNEPVSVANWLKQPIFEVDDCIYDLALTIKIVADKEGAHIDSVVDSPGIYIGTRTTGARSLTNKEKYVRSRLVKFGPFTYPHVVVFCVSRYLVTIAKECLTKYSAEVQSLSRLFSFTHARFSAIQERLAIINECPIIERIEELPLVVHQQRLVTRPPIELGLDSFDDEQRRAARLPEYGETYIGAPQPRETTTSAG